MTDILKLLRIYQEKDKSIGGVMLCDSIAEIERLRAIEKELSQFADGEPAYPGRFAYHPSGEWGVLPGVVHNGPFQLNNGRTMRPCDCYSTLEAAEAAKETT